MSHLNFNEHNKRKQKEREEEINQINGPVNLHHFKEKKPQRVPIPEKFDVDEDFGELIVQYRWWTPVAFFLLFFAIIWNGFLVFWYSIAISQGILIMMLFPLLHVAVGVGILYYVLCSFLNRTFILVSKERIKIDHQPMWWPGKKTIPVSDIEQLYVQEKVSNSKNGTTYTYELHYITNDNRSDVLLKGLETPQQAQYLENKIELYLGIEDETVQGEYPK